MIRREPQPETEVLQEFGRLWSQAVYQRTKPGTMPLLLSGGLDSRLLLAELHAQGVDLIAITFGSKDSSDIQIAQQCARIAGVHHRPLYLNTENWWHRREEAIWQTDGLVNGIHLHVAIALNELHAGNYHTLKNSTGDTLFGGSKLKKDSVCHWSHSLPQLLAAMYRKNPFFDYKEVEEVSIQDCKPYLYGPSPDCFTIAQRQRRMILTGPLAMAAHCEVVNPGISLPLLHLCLGSLSDEQRRESQFYKRFLVSHYPAYFRNIPWQKTGRGLAESFYTRITRGILWCMTHRLAALVRYQRKPINEYFVNYQQLVYASGIIEKLLKGELLVDEFLDGGARHTLKEAQTSLVAARLITAILTLETYLRQVANIPSLTLKRPLSQESSTRVG